MDGDVESITKGLSCVFKPDAGRQKQHSMQLLDGSNDIGHLIPVHPFELYFEDVPDAPGV